MFKAVFPDAARSPPGPGVSAVSAATRAKYSRADLKRNIDAIQKGENRDENRKERAADLEQKGEATEQNKARSRCLMSTNA
jgi:hypothetical protein